MTATTPERTYEPHDPTPVEAANADEVIVAISEALQLGRLYDALTPAERDLLEALRMRVRARVRQPHYDDATAYSGATQRLLASAQEVADELGERMLTSGEVAKALSVHRKTVTKWADAGQIPSIRTPGGHRRYPEADVRARMPRGAR